MFSPLERAILRTLVWFDLRQHPLTLFECWKFLYIDKELRGEISLGDIKQVLENLRDKNQVACYSGFWQLTNTKPYAYHRLQQARFGISKYKRAQAGARLISLIPFVRAIALVSSVSQGTCRRDSDIDLLIIAKKDHLFIARFFITGLIHMLGWHRHHAKIANRLCLSFYISTRALDFTQLKYNFDPYLEYGLASTLWLWGNNTYHALIRSNEWMKQKLPLWWRLSVNNYCLDGRREVIIRHIQRIGEIFFYLIDQWLERWLRAMQLDRIHRYPKSHLGDGTKAVIVNFDVLKFHESNRRELLNEEYTQRLARLGI